MSGGAAAAATPVRIGVLGAADIARRRMLPAFAEGKDTEVAAVASRDVRKAADLTARFGGRPLGGYQAVLDDPDVEAVYVPLPAALHAAWVERALLAGKHVLAEKPLTCEAARTRELTALAADRGLVLMENVMFVHHPQHTAVLDAVAAGLIGDLRSLSAAFTIPQLPEGDIRFDAALGGGALLDVGLYPVRAALHLLGPDLTVAGAVLHQPHDRQVETSGAALLARPDGVTAHLTFGIGHAYRCAYTLHGSTGRITVDRAFTPPADLVPAVTVTGAPGTEAPACAPHDQVAATVAAFARTVRGGGPVPGAQDAVREAELLDTIRDTAVRTGFQAGV